ncbi:MAG: hypothetical protein Q8L98_06785 [Chlamydiales bacterium]|nr:hypothetical protein [Chlamydiales bacterium]
MSKICTTCEILKLSLEECSSVLEGNTFILKVSAGYWPVPTTSGFMNPTALIACESCQPFYCTMAFDDSLLQWVVNCSYCAVDPNEEQSDSEGKQCAINDFDCRCCSGYTNRACSQCITPGYYSHGEKCVQCADEWYSQIWMSIVSFVIVAVLIIVALLIRNNLLALSLEVMVVVVLFFLGIGSTWFLIVMLLVLTVLFFTNSDIQEGVLKCLIFFVQTSSLVTANLYDWGSIYAKDSFLVNRNGLECLFPWYNMVIRFWMLMVLPICIVLLCIIVYYIGNIILSTRQQLHQNDLNDSDSMEQIHSDESVPQTSQLIDDEAHSSHNWIYRCFSFCLFLWYIIYYEIAASVCNFTLFHSEARVTKNQSLLFFFLYLQNRFLTTFVVFLSLMMIVVQHCTWKQLLGLNVHWTRPDPYIVCNCLFLQ